MRFDHQPIPLEELLAPPWFVTHRRRQGRPVYERRVSETMVERTDGLRRWLIDSSDEPIVPSTAYYGLPWRAWNALRQEVFARDGRACTYCGSRAEPLHCDHVVAWSKGGTNDLSNLTTACKNCNVGKKARSADEWRRLREASPCP